MSKKTKPKFIVQHFDDLTAVTCPFGVSRVALRHGAPHSLHLLDIQGKTALHRHRERHETYLVLEGKGEIDLDGATFPLSFGSVISIEPGVSHQIRGDLVIVSIVTPPFHPNDVEIVE